MAFAKNNTGVSARILKDSIQQNGARMTTFEFTVPKVLIAELNTHRALSKNLSSSRAIPVGKFSAIDSFKPAQWLKNRPGMMAKKEEIEKTERAEEIWSNIIEACKTGSELLSELGLHKQWTNRPNDWHNVAKGVLSGTDWNNFIWLRDDEAAQPEFQELAHNISGLLKSNKPEILGEDEWHVPYVVNTKKDGVMAYFDQSGRQLTVDDAIKLSSSCCAQVSYRNLDQSLEKALDIYEKLLGMPKKHASPFEHVATPIRLRTEPWNPLTWQDGITHVRKNGWLCSGNLRGWVQYRQLIPHHTNWG